MFGSKRQQVADKKAAQWGKSVAEKQNGRTFGVTGMLGTDPRNKSNTNPRKQPFQASLLQSKKQKVEDEKEIIRLIPTLEKRAIRKEVKQRAVDQEQRVKLLTKQAIECGSDLRQIQCTDVTIEKIEDHIAKRATSCRKERDECTEWGNAVASCCISNGIKMYEHSLLVDYAQHKADADTQRFKELELEFNAIVAENTYNSDDDSDDPDGGNIDPEKLKDLAYFEHELLEGDDPFFHDEDEIANRRVQREELLERIRIPFKPRRAHTWKPGAWEMLSEEKQQVYFDYRKMRSMRSMRYSYTLDGRAYVPEPELDRPQLPKLTTRQERVQKQAPKPAEMIDYFSAFGFRNEMEGRKALRQIKEAMNDKHVRLEPWHLWMHHVIIGSGRIGMSRMRRDQLEYHDKYKKAIEAARPKPPVIQGLDANGVIVDYEKYHASRQRLDAYEERQAASVERELIRLMKNESR